MTCPVIEQSPLLYAIDGRLGYYMTLKTIVLATAIILAAANAFAQAVGTQSSIPNLSGSINAFATVREQLWYVLPRMIGS